MNHYLSTLLCAGLVCAGASEAADRGISPVGSLDSGNGRYDAAESPAFAHDPFGTASGPSNGLVTSTFQLYADKSSGRALDATAMVKVGLVDDKGLAPDRHAYSLQWTATSNDLRTSAYAAVGHTWLSAAAGSRAEQVSFASTGRRVWLSEKVSAGWNLEIASVVDSGADRLLELSPYFTYRFSNGGKLKAYLLKGFGGTSQAFEYGFAYTRSF